LHAFYHMCNLEFKNTGHEGKRWTIKGGRARGRAKEEGHGGIIEYTYMKMQ
jgi:hypothetical protein